MSFAAESTFSDESSDSGSEGQAPGDQREAVASFGPIDHLSRSSGESPSPEKRKKKRKRSPADARAPLDDETHLRAMLGGKPCCPKNCMAEFAKPGPFGELQTFRSDWVALGKLDQDQVAACFGEYWQVLSFFRPLYNIVVCGAKIRNNVFYERVNGCNVLVAVIV